MLELSYSRLSSFLKCGNAFYLRYIQGIKYPGNSDMFLGSKIHKALETTFRSRIDTGLFLPLPDLLDAYSTDFDNSQYKATLDGDEVVDIVWRDDKATVKDIGIELLKVYHDTIISSNACPDPLEVEFWFEKKLADDVNMRLKADLITTEGAVIDFKVRKRAMSAADAEKDLQPTIYALGLGAQGIRFWFHQLTKTKIPKMVPMAAHRSAADVKWVEDVLIPPVVQMIRAGIFPPSGMNTWACDPRWCDFCGTECRSPRQITVTTVEKESD